MGAGSSSSRGISYKALLQATNKDERILNIILENFIKVFAKDDIRSLTNPQKCKRYLFMMSGALERTFKSLQVFPQKGKAGTIFFTKIDDVGKHESPLEKREFNRNCVYVAYYFIRLLQIFCALSLTVSNKEQVESYHIPYFQGQQQPIKLYGGSNNLFKLLGEKLLIEQYNEEGYGYREDKYRFRFYPHRGEKDYPQLYYYKETDKIKLEIIKNISEITCDITIENEYNIRLSNFKDIDQKVVVSKDVLVKLNNNKDINENARIISNSIYKTLNEKIASKNIKEQPKKPATDGAYTSFDRYEFINEMYVKKLSGHQTMPFAIARAYQLVDFQQLTPTSYVNDFTYPKIKEIAPYSASEGKTTLESILGLSSLDKLYYDQITGLEIESEGHVKPNDQAYYKFLQKIGCIFGDSIFVDNINNAKTDKEIKLILNQGLRIFPIKPPANPGPKSLSPKENKKLLENLQKIQQELFAFQLAHTRKAMAFIQANFIQNTPAGIYLNPKIQQGGFLYINWLGEQTRNMLLEYYMIAETIYNKGVSLVNGKAPTDFVKKCRSI